jgi:hypothetical protein
MFDAIKRKVGLAQRAEDNNDAEQPDVTFSTEETETVEATDAEVSEAVTDTFDDEGDDDSDESNYDFDSVDGRVEVSREAVDGEGDVTHFALLTEVAERAEVTGRRGVKRSSAFDGDFRTTQQGSLVAGGLRRSREGPEEAARELVSLRNELEEGAPDRLPSTGEKGMWKQARRVQVDVIEWVLDV